MPEVQGMLLLVGGPCCAPVPLPRPLELMRSEAITAVGAQR